MDLVPLHSDRFPLDLDGVGLITTFCLIWDRSDKVTDREALPVKFKVIVTCSATLISCSSIQQVRVTFFSDVKVTICNCTVIRGFESET